MIEQGGKASTGHTMEQRLREAATAIGQDPDEAVRAVEAALAEAMNNPPPMQPYPDPLCFHVGFDAVGGCVVYHAGEFETCERCLPETTVLTTVGRRQEVGLGGGVPLGRCRKADFPGLMNLARCVPPAGHDGICDIQTVQQDLSRPTSGEAFLLALIALGLSALALVLVLVQVAGH